MKLHVLVLCTNKNQNYLFESLKKKGHTWECYTPEELNLLISDSINGYDRIYADDGENEPKRLHLKSFSAIVTRLSGTGEYGLTILQHLNVNLGIYSAQTAHGIRIASNKVQTSQAISSAGLRSPVTVFGRNFKNAQFFVNKLWNDGIVIKSPQGSQGKTVAPMYDKRDATASLQMLNGCKIDVMVQQMIQGGGVDYRVIVIGNKVVCIMKRTSKDGSFFANISKGAKGEKVEFSEEYQDFCVRAAKAIGLQVAGIDVMISKTDGKIYLIECNSNFGTKSISYCNYNWFDDWVELLEKETNNKGESKQTESNLQLTNQEPKMKSEVPAVLSYNGRITEFLKGYF